MWWHMPELILPSSRSTNSLFYSPWMNSLKAASDMQLGPHLECVINDHAIRKFCLFCEGKVIRLVFALIWSWGPSEKPPVAHMYWVSTCILEQQALWRQTLKTYCSAPKKFPSFHCSWHGGDGKSWPRCHRIFSEKWLYPKKHVPSIFPVFSDNRVPLLLPVFVLSSKYWY